MVSMVKPVITILLLLLLAGCGRIFPVIPPTAQGASIQFSCSSCLPGQAVGFSPVAFGLYADVPEGAREIVWDYGDGTNGQGRFVTKSYHIEGLYKITVTAEGIEKRKRVRYQAVLYIKVLLKTDAGSNQSVEIDNRLAYFSVMGPKRLLLGERSLLCVYITPRRDLTVIDFRAIESAELVADGILQFTWLYQPAGAIREHCFSVRGFRVGSGYVQFIFFAATDKDGERSEGRIHIQIGGLDG